MPPELDEDVTREEAVQRLRAAAPVMLASYRALIQVAVKAFSGIQGLTSAARVRGQSQYRRLSVQASALRAHFS